MRTEDLKIEFKMQREESQILSIALQNIYIFAKFTTKATCCLKMALNQITTLVFTNR